MIIAAGQNIQVERRNRRSACLMKFMLKARISRLPVRGPGPIPGDNRPRCKSQRFQQIRIVECGARIGPIAVNNTIDQGVHRTAAAIEQIRYSYSVAPRPLRGPGSSARNLETAQPPGRRGRPA
jgi:hypothetical protein